jgi:hypothetical protein
LSARKRFTLTKVLETAKILHVEAEPVVEKAKKADVEEASATEKPAKKEAK